MEDALKNIILKHDSFASLNANDRQKLIEWCADEQDFQSLKQLFIEIDAWSEPEHENDQNTKQRLDQLFAIQYASSQSNTDSWSHNRRFSFLKRPYAITSAALAASVLFTWWLFQFNRATPVSRTTTHQAPREQKTHRKEKNILKNDQPIQMDEKKELVLAKVEDDSLENQLAFSPKEITSTSTEIHLDAQVQESLAQSPSMEGITCIQSVGSVSVEMPKKSTDFNWAKDFSSSSKNTKVKTDQVKQKDQFAVFNVKSMPEMLDRLVAAY